MKKPAGVAGLRVTCLTDFSEVDDIVNDGFGVDFPGSDLFFDFDAYFGYFWLNGLNEFSDEKSFGVFCIRKDQTKRVVSCAHGYLQG
jgi:hypothetical protein